MYQTYGILSGDVNLVDPIRKSLSTTGSNVLIVDDHAIVRAGIRQILSALESINVAEAGDANEALRLAKERRFDVVLMDVNLPKQNGLETMESILHIDPSAKFLFLSMHPESRFALQVLRAGASGYLQKDALADELVNAIETVLSGKKYINSNVAELLVSATESENSTLALHDNLSKRELEIFRELIKGKTVTQIAADTCLSIKTISTYRARIMLKLRLHTNADLIFYAVQNNLASDDLMGN